MKTEQIGTFFKEDIKPALTDSSLLDKIRIHGVIEIDGVYCRFSFTRQTGKSEYAYRGSMTLLNPDGTPHALQGKALKKAREHKSRKTDTGKVIIAQCNLLIPGKLCCEPLITGYRYLTAKMKEYLIQKAEELIVDCPEVTGSVSRSFDPNYDPISMLVLKYGKGYLDSKTLALSTYKRQDSLLQHAAARFSSLPVSKIDTKTINTIQKSSSPLRQDTLSLLSGFWKYCMGKSPLSDDPFAEYKRLYRPKKKPKGKDRDTTVFMEHDEEVELNKTLAMPEIFLSDETKAIILMKDAGMDAPDISEFKLSNIILDPDNPEYVRLRILTDKTGPIKNYSRPVFAFAAYMLQASFAEAKKKYRSKLGDHYFLEKSSGEKYTSSEITTMVRQMLKKIGCTRKVLSVSEGVDSRNRPAGNSFLLETYRNKIENECGFSDDSPECHFLLGEAMRNDVTSGHYRSFTSPENQWMLFVYMRRVPSGLSVSSWKTISKFERTSSGWQETIQPKDTSKKSVISRTYVLQPGEEILIGSDFGVDGELSARIPGSDPSIESEIPTVHYSKLQEYPSGTVPTAPAEEISEL